MAKPLRENGRCFDMSQDINGWQWQQYHKLWREFREKYPEYDKYSEIELREIMRGFWKYCQKVLTETEHGIHLKGLGYLANTVFSNTKKNVLKWHGKVIQNFRSGGIIYRCYFYPVYREKTPLKGWMFKPSKPLKAKMKKNIQKGLKYKNHIHFLDDNAKLFR